MIERYTSEYFAANNPWMVSSISLSLEDSLLFKWYDPFISFGWSFMSSVMFESQGSTKLYKIRLIDMLNGVKIMINRKNYITEKIL